MPPAPTMSLVEETAPAPAGRAVAPGPQAASAAVSFLAGVLTAFTVPVVGEMPVGELVLGAVAVWVAVCLAFHHAWPGPLFRRRDLGVLLGAQAVALAAYIVSDLYMHSSGRDMARGWGRLFFVAVDLLAVVYLLGRSPRNFLWMLAGQMAGEVAAVLAFGALFDDMWKFGFGVPVTYAVVLLASLAGRAAVATAAAALGALHLVLDFRSAGGLCLLLAAGTALQLLPVRARRFALPAGAVAAAALLAAVLAVTRPAADAHRGTRSDIDRSSMLRAAAEAFRDSPLLGQGSWFSRSQVYDQFLLIRDAAAREAGIGGFAGPNDADTDKIALHSQILVALAEGGLFGGAFFFVFGAGLVSALARLVFRPSWRRADPAVMLYLLFAAWHLAMSPFSGAHRVHIALSAGLILLVRAEAAGTAGEVAA
jgi:hypothetical protein